MKITKAQLKQIIKEELHDNGAAVLQLALKGPHVGIGLVQGILVQVPAHVTIEQGAVPTAVEDGHAIGRGRTPPEAPEEGTQLLVAVGGRYAGDLEAARIHRLDHAIDHGALAGSAKTFHDEQHGDAQFATTSLERTQFQLQFLDRKLVQVSGFPLVAHVLQPLDLTEGIIMS